MRYRTVVAAFPDRFSPEPVVRALASQVLIHAVGSTVYDAVDYFERALFRGGLGTPCRVTRRVPLRAITSLHNSDGMRDLPQIAGMIRQILAGGDVLHVSGLPNMKVVVTWENETVLFDGHHTVMAYLATGRNYLDEVPHLIVHDGKRRVADREILVFFGTHSKELTPSDWRDYVINWQAPADHQLCWRTQGNVGELFDTLYAQISVLNTLPTISADSTFSD
ncbi:MAG: hypothetical protein JSU77_05560 [Fidelibacterota bacterium]|nr:MAG: hypothetical protein JSU77_05560 [Candidatus Neomarinimicrobiota bacterium]